MNKLIICSTALSLLVSCAGTRSMVLSSDESVNEELRLKPVAYNHIEGAPLLAQPRLLETSSGEALRVDMSGMAAATVWDMNGDGVRDLLVGEFLKTSKFSEEKGSNLRVFENTGTDLNPEYASDGYYLKDINDKKLYIYGF